nr:YtfJ family protein [Oceanicoccus sp. KOV_DT_Chl]
MPIKIIVCSMLLMVSSWLTQADITVGEKLPELEIKKKGELILTGDDISYAEWSTKALQNKVQILQYLAGRMTASKVNKPFTDKLETLDLSADHHHTTTIINLNDTFFGTSGFVASELKKNKIKYPSTSIVADKKGSGQKSGG